MNNKLNFFLLVLLFPLLSLHAQEKHKYTFEEVILTARQQSPQAVLARHRFRGSYWEYRTYRAEFLPTLTMNTVIPDLNRSIERITLQDGTDAFVPRSLVNSSANLELNQNIGLTGGSIYMSSDLQRIDILSEDGGTSYLSYPVN